MTHETWDIIHIFVDESGIGRISSPFRGENSIDCRGSVLTKIATRKVLFHALTWAQKFFFSASFNNSVLDWCVPYYVAQRLTRILSTVAAAT